MAKSYGPLTLYQHYEQKANLLLGTGWKINPETRKQGTDWIKKQVRDYHRRQMQVRAASSFPRPAAYNIMDYLRYRR